MAIAGRCKFSVSEHLASPLPVSFPYSGWKVDYTLIARIISYDICDQMLFFSPRSCLECKQPFFELDI